jgi:tetratricopeptide (TPR) repeat protein
MNLTSWRTILRSCALLALAPLSICSQEVTSPQVNGSTHARLINSLAVDRLIYKVKPPGGHGPVPGCPKCQPPGWSTQKDLVKVRESGLSALKVKPDDLNAALSLAERLSRDLDSSVIDDAESVNLLAINLIAAGKKPEGVSDQNWNKEEALASCLQNLGYIAALRNQIDKALYFYERATALDKSDPFNYLAIGSIHKYKFNAAAMEYLQLVKTNADRGELDKALKEALGEAGQTSASFKLFVGTKAADGTAEFAVGAQQVLRTFSNADSQDLRKTLDDLLGRRPQ